MIKWYRSWPSTTDWAEKNLDTVNHIVDDLPRIIVWNYDYGKSEWPSEDKPGFCMLEWDIALDPISMRAFAAEALIEPREILVAPYRFHDTWCMFMNNDGGGPSSDGRPVYVGEDRCDSFGLGCIYIPTVILNEFLVVMDKFGFSDGTFGKWYRQKYGQARVTWKVHPQHIHDYPM